MERKNTVQDCFFDSLDWSDEKEVNRAFRTMTLVLKGGSIEEVLDFCDRALDQSPEWSPRLLRLLFGQYSGLATSSQFPEFYIRLLNACVRCDPDELNHRSLELLDFLEQWPSVSAQAGDTYGLARVLLDQVLGHNPHFFSAQLLRYSLMVDKEMEKEEESIWSDVMSEAHVLDATHSHDGGFHRQKNGDWVEVYESAVLEGRNLNIMALEGLSALPPIFVRLAAFYRAHKHNRDAGFLLFFLNEHFKAERQFPLMIDFWVQLEAIINDMDTNLMPPNEGAIASQARVWLNTFNGVLAARAQSPANQRTIDVLREKYLIPPPKVVYDAMDSTVLVVQGIIGES